MSCAGEWEWDASDADNKNVVGSRGDAIGKARSLYRRRKSMLIQPVPCQNCVKKDCVEICPNGTNVKRKVYVRPCAGFDTVLNLRLDPKDSLLKDLRGLLASHGLRLRSASPSPTADPHVTPDGTFGNPHDPTSSGQEPARSASMSAVQPFSEAVSVDGNHLRHDPRAGETSVKNAEPGHWTDTLSKSIGTEVEGGRTIVPGLSNHGRSYASVIYQGCDDAPEVIQRHHGGPPLICRVQ